MSLDTGNTLRERDVGGGVELELPLMIESTAAVLTTTTVGVETLGGSIGCTDGGVVGDIW